VLFPIGITNNAGAIFLLKKIINQSIHAALPIAA
jgi:hypothetical protein